MPSEAEQSGSQERLLNLIEKLLELPAADLRTTLNQTTQYVQEVMEADKVDAFLYMPAKNLLRACGTSDTPLGQLQLAQGLDILPLANGGSVAGVFTTGEPHISGHMDQLESEVPGLVHVLGIRSHIAVPIEVAGERRGVLSAQSKKPDFFTPEDLRFLTSVARWTGALTHRAELVEATTAAAIVKGRQSAADELLLVLAHDLHNHLTPLRWRIELLRLNAAEEDRQRDGRDAEMALSVVDRLARLVTDLLDVGRLDQGLFSVQPVPVDLVALARSAGQEFATPEVAVHVEGLPELLAAADPDRMRQALENLIGNAVKHTPSGKAVSIRIRTDIDPISAKRMAIIEVTDQGPGVPAEILPVLFERFAKGTNSKGLGLGLYLARHIVEAHGGSLSVQSPPGQGASLQIRMPAEDPRKG
jgi:two-component system OmpR family sensor kinase